MNYKRINQNEKGEQKMGKTMKRVVAVAGLSLLIGLQSPSSVQAAVNYEACPFCGTMVTRGTALEKVGEEFEECTEHTKCIVKIITYDKYDTVNCQTADCPINHRVPCGQQTIVQHFRNQ